MNSKQKAARIVGMIFVAVAALFPPWQLAVNKEGTAQVSSLGYHPLWSPPSTEVEADAGAVAANYRINLIRLGVQLVVLLLAVNGAVYLLKDKRPLPRPE
ncbi:MAG: hypothetical protein HYY23_11035 [Verrucomicrobia bacterium]|nr:hypothetical protein [Verrucomicrobiota bacterium]